MAKNGELVAQKMIVAAPWRWMNIAPRAKAETSKLGSSVGSLGWNSADDDLQLPSSGRFWVALRSLPGLSHRLINHGRASGPRSSPWARAIGGNPGLTRHLPPIHDVCDATRWC